MSAKRIFAEINRRVLAHQVIVGNEDVFAGIHTGRRLCRVFRSARKKGWLFTRISASPAGQGALYGRIQQGVHVHAMPIRYDHAAWPARFLANWPEGSPAWLS